MAQWQSTRLVNVRSRVRSSVEACLHGSVVERAFRKREIPSSILGGGFFFLFRGVIEIIDFFLCGARAARV